MPAQSPGGTEGFTAQERAALKARAAELKAEARRARDADKAAAEPADALAKIAEMPEGDRSLAERVHAAVLAAARAGLIDILVCDIPLRDALADLALG